MFIYYYYNLTVKYLALLNTFNPSNHLFHPSDFQVDVELTN